MADKKISALTAATTPLAGTEVLPIVQSSTTKKVSVADLTAGRDTSVAKLTATDNIVIATAGKGIDFSATAHAAGMTSELLNDYEEGTFTPTIAGNSTAGSNTYAVQNGYYTKVGNRVMFNLDVAILSKDAAMAGYVLVKGLPYTSNSASNNGAGAAVGNADLWNLSAGYTFLLPMVQAISDAVILREGGDNVNAQLVQAAAVSSNTRIAVSGHYFV